MKHETPEKIAELKKQFGAVYEGMIQYTNENGDLETVEFIFRKPMVTDVEMMSQQAQKSPTLADMNFLNSLIVLGDEAKEKLRDRPMAVGTFIKEEISPFFGGNATTGKKAL